eukprot:scaffold3931_cov172-Amphora_coffeaeformis.AAC.8
MSSTLPGILKAVHNVDHDYVALGGKLGIRATLLMKAAVERQMAECLLILAESASEGQGDIEKRELKKQFVRFVVNHVFPLQAFAGVNKYKNLLLDLGILKQDVLVATRPSSLPHCCQKTYCTNDHR